MNDSHSVVRGMGAFGFASGNMSPFVTGPTFHQSEQSCAGPRFHSAHLIRSQGADNCEIVLELPLIFLRATEPTPKPSMPDHSRNSLPTLCASGARHFRNRPQSRP